MARRFQEKSPTRVLRPAQPPIQRVAGSLPSGVEREEHGADYSPPPTAKIKNERSLTCHAHSHAFMVSTGTTSLVVTRRSILRENTRCNEIAETVTDHQQGGLCRYCSYW